MSHHAETSDGVMSKKLSSSKILPLGHITNHSAPVTDQLTAESQFRNMPVGGRIETLQMHFLNIAPFVYSSSSSPAVCLHLPLGPGGKQQTSTSLHVETRLGFQNTPIYWERAQRPCPHSSGIWIHLLHLGDRKDEDPCAVDPIWSFKSINQPASILKHMHCVRRGLQNITCCL